MHIAIFYQKLLYMPIPALDALRYHSIGWHQPPADWRISAHRHGVHELIVVTGGAQWVEAGGRRVEARAGDLLLYGAGLVHEEWAEPGTRLESFFLSFDLPGLCGAELRTGTDRDGRMRQLARWIHADRQDPAPEASAKRHAFLAALLHELTGCRDQDEDGLVRDLRDQVQARTGARLSLGLLAGRAGLSTFHYAREYRRRTGRSPMADVRLLRAEQARELIHGSGLPLKEIAARTGFGTEQALCRVFRRLFDVTPGALRRFKRQGGVCPPPQGACNYARNK